MWRTCRNWREGRVKYGWPKPRGMAEAVKARVGMRWISPPQCQRLFFCSAVASEPPLTEANSKWNRWITKETESYNYTCKNRKTQKTEPYLPPVRPPSKKKSWLLEERKTNCIYLVLGSLAQILDLSPSRYHCDSFESKQHYFLSVPVFVLSFFVVVSLFNRWLSALSQSLSWTSFKARAELVWISPDPTCSIRNISFEGSVTSPLILQPWFWFKNWRKSLVSPREVKWNTFLWVEGYLFGSWLPLRLNFSNAGGFPVYMHLSLSSGKEGIGLFTMCFMIFLTTSLQGTHIQTALPLASRIAPGSQTVFFSAWPPSLRVGVWLGLFK